MHEERKLLVGPASDRPNVDPLEERKWKLHPQPTFPRGLKVYADQAVQGAWKTPYSNVRR